MLLRMLDSAFFGLIFLLRFLFAFSISLLTPEPLLIGRFVEMISTLPASRFSFQFTQCFYYRMIFVEFLDSIATFIMAHY